MLSSSELSAQANIDIRNDRYPFCVVWTALPPITWIVPLIGHTGICRSDGAIVDFWGPFTVNVGKMCFGRPLKYAPLDVSRVDGGTEAWDAGVQTGMQEYQAKVHQLFTDNCHSHVASSLNAMRYGDKNNYTMLDPAFLAILRGKWVSITAFFYVYGPFLVGFPLGTYFLGWKFAVAWLAIIAALLLWFFMATYFCKCTYP